MPNQHLQLLTKTCSATPSQTLNPKLPATTCPRRYYGLLAQRFCYLKREYQEVFEDCFRRQYNLIHRLETNKLRNVAKFFGHLLATDAVSWGVLQNVVLTEDATTSSARIFIKILFQVRTSCSF